MCMSKDVVLFKHATTEVVTHYSRLESSLRDSFSLSLSSKPFEYSWGINHANINDRDRRGSIALRDTNLCG